MGMKLRVSRPALERILSEAERTAPEECCGILLGSPEAIEAARATANVARDRMGRFEIDPQALVDAHREARRGGPQIAGYFHSHPGGPAEPSNIDRASAAGDGMIWAIVGEAGVAFWRDEEAGFVLLSYVVEDR